MAERTVIYWRDIPAQVIVGHGRTMQKRELPERFVRAVERAAMLAGLRESDAYLGQWRRGAPQPCGEDLAAEADAMLAELEARYDDARLAVLVHAEGYDRPAGA
jgi:hypothetical protein